MKEYCDILASRDANAAIKVKVLRLKTGEILEGTLNVGQALEVIGTLEVGDDAAAANTGDPSTTANGGDFIIVTDDTQAIGVKVPAAWAAQVDGSQWETTWTKADGSQYKVLAASVIAAPDLHAFNSLNGPGVWVAASRDFGRIGGYAQLLEGTQTWFASCTLSDSGAYEDVSYEGRYNLWERCGDTGRITSVVLAVRPKQNPTAFLMLVVINIDPNTQDVEQVLTAILESFDVIGALP